MSDGEVWGLVVAFPDGSASFVNGFEAGLLAAKMQDAPPLNGRIEITTHTDNREVIDRMARAYGWTVERLSAGVDGWDETVLRKLEKLVSPQGLRLVDSAFRPDPVPGATVVRGAIQPMKAEEIRTGSAEVFDGDKTKPNKPYVER